MGNYYAHLFLALTIFLAACEEVKDNHVEEKVDETQAIAEIDEDEIGIELTVEEARKIIEQYKQDKEKIMANIEENYASDWMQQNWTIDRNDHGKEFQHALSIVRDYLSSVMTEQGLDEFAELYTRAYFCQCDWDVNLYENISSRLEILEQSENHFIVKFISLEEMGIVDQSGMTNIWTFHKEGDIWKLEEKQLVLPEAEPLNLTAEDLQAAFGDKEFVEQIKFEGHHYLVLLQDDFYEVWNVIDGTTNYELSEKYSSHAYNGTKNEKSQNEIQLFSDVEQE